MTITQIFAEARSLGNATDTSYTDTNLLRRVNSAYEDIVATILDCDGTWQFDDTNYTSHPIGTTDLVASQQDYTFAETHLIIERVEVKNASGHYEKLAPLDKSQVDVALTEYMSTAGMPIEYDKQGNSIFLYPAPASASVTLSSGLKVYYKRTADTFSSSDVTDGTATPGFASPFHPLLAYKAALPYCSENKPERVPFILSEIKRLEDKLINFYSRREKDIEVKLTMAPISFR